MEGGERERERERERGGGGGGGGREEEERVGESCTLKPISFILRNSIPYDKPSLSWNPTILHVDFYNPFRAYLREAMRYYMESVPNY